jgi:hypothetical protein
LRFVGDEPDEHPGAQVDRLHHERKPERPGSVAGGGPAVGDRERRPRQAGSPHALPCQVLAVCALDRLRACARQTEVRGQPGNGAQVVVAGRDDTVEPQHLVQPVYLGQQRGQVIGLGRDQVVRREQRVHALAGAGTQVVVQVPGEEREPVSGLTNRPGQQGAHRTDPTLHQQQMTHRALLDTRRLRIRKR